MARVDDTELIDTFEEFYRSYYPDEIAELAQKYPNEQKSLYIDWQDLYRFDSDLGDDFRNKPNQLREYAEEALRLYDLPADVSLAQAHIRVENIPQSTDIRAIRADQRGNLVAVQGIIRKATDVRPKITQAAFECQRCGTLSRIPQDSGDFQEPHECQGCERQGPFRVNFDQSEFIDAQKLRVQESPEGLRGGETPQSIDINIEDDITGEVTPGDHVTVTGILKLEQQGDDRDKSALFDVYMEGLSVTIDDEQFEEMDISDEDKKEIIELSNQPDIYDQMVGAIAPSIYGYEMEKRAMVFQLFSGVTKFLPDGSRTRGDLHILMVGDPGTGKSQLLQYIKNIAPRSVYTSGKGSSSAGLCVTGDTLIHTPDGFKPIRDLATKKHPDPVAAETAARLTDDVYTFNRESGTIERSRSSHVWRMPEKECRRIETSHGKEIETSVNTPLLVCGDQGLEWKQISDIQESDHVAIPKYSHLTRSSPSIDAFFEFTNEKLKPSDESIEFLRSRLTAEFGTLRDAAAALDLTEDFIYDSLSNRYLPQEKLDRILDAIDATQDDIDIEYAMLRHGQPVRIPDEFTADLLYLIGLVFGDGDIMVSDRGGNRGRIRISNSDEQLLEEAARIIEDVFDRPVHIEYQDDRVPCVRLHSATIARFFSNLGMESPKNDLELAPELTTAEHSDAFLQGVYDADGSVCSRESGSSSIQFSTICDDFARQIQLMLETHGIRANRRERDRRGTSKLESGYVIESNSVQTHLTIYGKDIETFADQIGFQSEAKRDALESIANGASRRDERIPIGNNLAIADGGGGKFYNNVTNCHNPGRQRALELLDRHEFGDLTADLEEVVGADLLWDEVVETEETGKKELFDLTVPDTHNFVANGIITHNTAAAVRDDFGEGQQWTLEAGALVLADQGIAAVDELDKMRCVTGETLVHTGDGIRPVRELAHDACTDEIEEYDNGRTYRDVDLTVWTMTDDGQLTTRDVTAIHEYEAPDELHDVTLESGECLTTTADHPFFVLEDGERVEKPANELSPNDWVYIPDGIPRPAGDGGTIPAQLDEPEELPLPDGPSESAISPADGKILGYLAGDGNVYSNDDQGYGIRFTNKEETLLTDFERACRTAFEQDPVRPQSEQRADGVETVHCFGKSIVDNLLDAGLTLETYEGKEVPEAVGLGSSEVKASFLRALADSEGTVDDRKVALYSASYELLMGAKMLLSEFGVTSQIQTRERDESRDIYVLAITAADSLSAFRTHIGFKLERKQEALDAVCDRVSGDRTIIDVLPECGDLFRGARTSLRLHQSECGLTDATYCNFETGVANASLSKAQQILESYETRHDQATSDCRTLSADSSWSELERLKERYHVSQSELATGTSYSQQQISRMWGQSEPLRTELCDQFGAILQEIIDTDLSTLRNLIRGDAKWRRVDAVEPTEPTVEDGQIRLVKRQVADLLDTDEGQAECRAREVLSTPSTADSRLDIQAELERHNIPQWRLAEKLAVDQSTVSRWLNGVVDGLSFEQVWEAASSVIDARRRALRGILSELDERREPKVYDLTVEGTHNFVANSMVVHNSEDQSAMHQALEQQTISVSKAGINATLKSRCSLLAAANPTYGRFDEYEPIGEQIDLAPPLISRFDLIFTVTDKPDAEKDAELAEHILQTNYAGELNTHRTETNTSNYTEEQVEDVTEDVAPTIDAEFLRKYVAYAQRNCFPTMTDEARESIQEFYVDLRAQGDDEDSPVPVTARKLEALVRLAEASARVRLSDSVEQSDAQRAIDIARYSLEEIGLDPETGELDADMIETGTTKSQRDRIKNIKQLISTIEEEYDEGAPVEIIIERAEEEGMEASKAEHEIDKLKQKGEVYEPQGNHLRTT